VPFHNSVGITLYRQPVKSCSSLSTRTFSLQRAGNSGCGVYGGIDSRYANRFKSCWIKNCYTPADQAAKGTRRNRSALVSDALREHLRRLEVRGREERDRQGYSGAGPGFARTARKRLQPPRTPSLDTKAAQNYPYRPKCRLARHERWSET